MTYYKISLFKCSTLFRGGPCVTQMLLFMRYNNILSYSTRWCNNPIIKRKNRFAIILKNFYCENFGSSCSRLNVSRHLLLNHLSYLCGPGVAVVSRLVGGHQVPRGVHPQRLHPGHRQEQTLHLHRGNGGGRGRGAWAPPAGHLSRRTNCKLCQTCVCVFTCRISSSSAAPTTRRSTTRSGTPSSRGSSEHTSTPCFFYSSSYFSFSLLLPVPPFSAGAAL